MKLAVTVKRIGFSCLFFLLGIVAVLLYPFPLSAPNTTIEVYYVHYACGECYVQNKVLKVSSNDDSEGEKLIDRDSRKVYNSNKNPLRFIGWDILVFYKGNEDAIIDYLGNHHDEFGNCIAPSFRLTGRFKRRLIYALLYEGDRYDGIYFDAQTAVAVHQALPGCKWTKEIPL